MFHVDLFVLQLGPVEAEHFTDGEPARSGWTKFAAKDTKTDSSIALPIHLAVTTAHTLKMPESTVAQVMQTSISVITTTITTTAIVTHLKGAPMETFV